MLLIVLYHKLDIKHIYREIASFDCTSVNRPCQKAFSIFSSITIYAATKFCIVKVENDRKCL